MMHSNLGREGEKTEILSIWHRENKKILVDERLRNFIFKTQRRI